MKARLVAAVMELWPDRDARRGIVIDDVIKVADVSRGTFYKHFTSLEDALDVIGRQHADEMTNGFMPIYDVLINPLDRTALGLQLFLWRGVFDAVWARFVSRTDYLFRDTELLANIMADLENGRAAGVFSFKSIDIASNFVIGASMGGISRFVAVEVQPLQVFELVGMVLAGLGVPGDVAHAAIGKAYLHLKSRAPGVLGWWRDLPDGHAVDLWSTDDDRPHVVEGSTKI